MRTEPLVETRGSRAKEDKKRQERALGRRSGRRRPRGVVEGQCIGLRREHESSVEEETVEVRRTQTRVARWGGSERRRMRGVGGDSRMADDRGEGIIGGRWGRGPDAPSRVADVRWTSGTRQAVVEPVDDVMSSWEEGRKEGPESLKNVRQKAGGDQRVRLPPRCSTASSSSRLRLPPPFEALLLRETTGFLRLPEGATPLRSSYASSIVKLMKVLPNRGLARLAVGLTAGAAAIGRGLIGEAASLEDEQDDDDDDDEEGTW